MMDWEELCSSYKDLWLCSFEKALEMCPNLKILIIADCALNYKHIKMLKIVIGSLKKLVISFDDSPDCSSDCSALWKELAQLEQITVSCSDNFNDLLKHCMNIFNLNIFFDDGDLTEKDFADICDRNGHCLQQLALINFTKLAHIDLLISEKLPNLTTLILHFPSFTSINTLSQLPHLKYLEIYSGPNELKMNLLMRNLSDLGILEELSIRGSFCYDDDINESPLAYYQLQSFEWQMDRPCLSLLKAITKSQMPKITEFTCRWYPKDFNGEKNDSHELFAFIQSKKTLKYITLYWSCENPFAIVREIIKILKTQSRPYLSLTFKDFKCNGEEEVSKIVPAAIDTKM